MKETFPKASFIGFESMLESLRYTSEHAHDHYPPHNVVQTNETDYFIEIAVAGFTMSELTVEEKSRTLIVLGNHVSKGRTVIHRGISTKGFKKEFRLSEYVKVLGANLKDGILAVQLKVVVPQETRPRNIIIENEENNNGTNTKRHL